MDARRSRAPRPAVVVAGLGCCLGLVVLSGCSESPSPSSGAKRDQRDKEASTTQAAQADVPGAVKAVDDLQDGYLKVIKDVLPSVVQIQATSDL